MGCRSGSRIMLIALLWLLMAGCAPLPFPAVHSQRPAADPYQPYRPSMQPWMQARPEKIGTLPRYTLRVELDGAGSRLSGDMRVSVPNSSRDAWPGLVFRLHPNTLHYQGMIAVSQVVLEGQPVVTEMVEGRTRLRVVLPAHLPPDQEGGRADRPTGGRRERYRVRTAGICQGFSLLQRTAGTAGR